VPSDGGSIPPASIRNSYEQSELEFLILRSKATKEVMINSELRNKEELERGFPSLTLRISSLIALRIVFPSANKIGSQFMVFGSRYKPFNYSST
jgi:hypothetical protein